MANLDDIYTKNFKLEIDNVLSLRQATGHYAQSEIFKSKGPLGQEMEWALRVYPRGDKTKTKNNVSVFLHLLDGKGSKEVRMDWNLSIINAKGNKVNKHEEKSCVYDLENDTNDIGWGFDNFISRSNLDDSKKNYIVDGHKLILHCELFIKKDLQAAELAQEKEMTKNLKRKLESKEEEIKRMESEYGKCKKYYQKEIEKLEIENSTMTKKLKEEEEERCSKLQSEYEQRLKNCREYIANLQNVKLAAIEKCRKEEEAKKNLEKEKLAAEEKCQKEIEARKKLQGKYEKLYNHYVRDSSKFIEENDGDMINETSGDDYAQNIYKFIDEMNNKSEEPSTNGIVETKENEEEIITIV